MLVEALRKDAPRAVLGYFCNRSLPTQNHGKPNPKISKEGSMHESVVSMGILRKKSEPTGKTQGSLAMAIFNSPIEDYLRGLYETIKSNTAGRLADYIPELTKVDPEWLGIALVTADGHIYEVGDSRQTFTIQSISKPFLTVLRWRIRRERKC